MIKKLLIAAALVIVSPTLVFSQDIFWSLEQDSLVSNKPMESVGTSGTAYIFSDGMFEFDALDLNFTSSDASVLLLTGGTAFNDPFNVLPAPAFNSSELTINSGSDGNLFSINLTENGIRASVSPLFNPHWEAGVGPNGAVLLASVDYDLVGDGNATLGFSLGNQGALRLPSEVLTPSFGNATVSTAIPEPTSASLLVLGVIGMVARRGRARA